MDPSNSGNLEQLALNGLILRLRASLQHTAAVGCTFVADCTVRLRVI